MTEQTGTLWLVASDVIAVIQADQNVTSQADDITEDDGNSVEVDAPIVEPIEINVAEDGTYEVEVPAGTDYELILVTEDATKGVKIDEIAVEPETVTEVIITEDELQPVGHITLTTQSLITGNVLANARVMLLSGGIDMTSNDEGKATLESLAPW
ncbi:hypothetical protein [Psychrosphaera algicola]|uniref:Uncharacterized protein n=1 Tax=Psychrosphaera algicola TaxID=3023714 RepID=A0ABT5FC54_9GAMM|nr:hypothetical protein [Psychrosphaera sp. G1-22]MDC2888724.1 hypothetical protein [Psychrosphaera sp. G1-22]